MARRIPALLATAAMIAVIALPAGANTCRLIRGGDTPDNPADDVEACRLDTWFHQGTAKVGNLAAQGQGTYPSWNITAPTAPLSSGGAGAYGSTSVFHQVVAAHDPKGTPTFTGSFEGAIDNLAVTMYLVAPVRAAAVNHAISLRVRVDGQDVYVTGAAPDRPALSNAATPGVRVFRFALTNMYQVFEDLQLSNPTGPHQIEVAIAPWFLLDDNAVYLYDASDAASGMIFNVEPSNLAGYTVISASV